MILGVDDCFPFNITEITACELFTSPSFGLSMGGKSTEFRTMRTSDETLIEFLSLPIAELSDREERWLVDCGRDKEVSARLSYPMPITYKSCVFE